MSVEIQYKNIHYKLVSTLKPHPRNQPASAIFSVWFPAGAEEGAAGTEESPQCVYSSPQRVHQTTLQNL